MNHDVFISYSSKNSAAAQAICHQLEDNNIKCWMAPRDIPVGAKYASVITQAIKECKAVVLVFSEYSAISPWVESEINIAFSNRRPIVPYKIDTTPLENYDEFYLMLNNRHWIEAYPDFKTRFADLVTVISNLVGAKISNVTKPTPTPAKTYKVGDYYNDGVREGVVFEVSADGRHGKIVSMKQSAEYLQWSSDSAEQKRLIGADSKTDGAYNMAKVTARPDWQRKYSAFKWCADLGEGWYLPSKEELLTIYKNRGKLKHNLTDWISYLYWSSTEYNEFCAWGVNMFSSATTNYRKCYGNYVRAVSAF